MVQGAIGEIQTWFETNGGSTKKKQGNKILNHMYHRITTIHKYFMVTTEIIL